VLITVVTTLGAITPPVGVNMFIVASMAKDVPMTDVFKGATYFMAAYCICIALLMAFPSLVTFAPGLMQ
jgi:TRAP-type C4-dicarboxylate transport system permease large subunit